MLACQIFISKRLHTKRWNFLALVRADFTINLEQGSSEFDRFQTCCSCCSRSVALEMQQYQLGDVMPAVALMVTAVTNLLLLRATRHYDRVCRDDHIYHYLCTADAQTRTRYNNAIRSIDIFIELGDRSPRNLILLRY